MSDDRRRTAIMLTATAVLSMFIFTAAVPAAMATPPTNSSSDTPPAYLRLKAGTFDPLVDGVDWVPALYRRTATDPFGDLFIVQFTGPVQAGQRDQMVALGAAYHSYLPDNAFLVYASSKVLDAVKELPFVRVAVPYQPYLRIDADLLTSAWASLDTLAMVKVENFGDPGRVNAFVEARGGSFVSMDGPFSTLAIPRSLLPALAALPTAARVEPWVPRTLDNYLSSVIQGARQVPDGAFNPGTLRMWSYNPALARFEGTTGAGIIVAVSDTGVDTTHPALTANGKLVFFDTMGGPYTDTYGHGTHTSGTVLGNGMYRVNDTALAAPGLFAGVAPEALLIHQNIFASQSSNARAALVNGQYGASVSSGSWANGGGYGGDSRQYDGFARDSWPDTTNVSSVGEQSVLYFFSAGNAGGSKTIGNPAEGKNVMAVGATGDNKNLSWNAMAGFSSRGTADDGRIKPDLVAPGVDIMSTYCPTCSMGVGNDVGTSYGEQSGTSMSCPGAAGAAAVAYQFYRDREGHLPKADMIKAILINGVDEMDNYPVLGPDQGFGRLNLSTSLLTLPNRQQIWKERPASLQTGDEIVYTYPIADATQPFVVTLAWLDEPGDTGAALEIVNDLDLWIVGPNGDIFWGNSMDQDGNSLANGVVDSKNTVEKVKITAPARGYYEVHIKGKNVPVGPQDFSLAIRGNLATSWYDILMEKVDTNATAPIEGQVVTFNASVWNRGTDWVNGSTVTLVADTPSGTLPVATTFVASIGPNEKVVVATNWTTLRGTVNFRASVSAPLGQVEFSTTNNEANKSFFVKGYGYTVASDGLPLYNVNPATTLTLTFNVTNTGNVQDRIAAFVTSDTTAISSFIDFPTLTIDPNKWGHFHLTVIIPAAAKAGDHVTLTVSTRSLNDARYSTSFQATVIVNQLYAFGFGLAPDTLQFLPTTAGDTSIALENRGNGWDNLTLEAIGVPGGWVFTFDRQVVGLADNASAQVGVHVEAPDTVDAGLRFVISVRAASEGAPSRFLDVTVTVLQVYGWTATVTGPASPVQAGDAIEVPIEAKNLGNGVDNVTIELTTPPGWPSALTRSRLLLQAYGNLSSTATVRVDRYALAGTYSLTFKFGGARNFTRQTISVEVAQKYELDVEGPGYTLQMGQGEVNTFEVTVVNYGNGPATVTPHVLAPEGVTIITVVPSALLQRNETAKFTFQVIVARDAPADLQSFTIDVRTGPSEAVSIPLGMYINIHEVVETPVVTDPGSEQGGQGYLSLVLGMAAVVAVLLPVGLLFVRRAQAKRAPPPEVIVQTHEDANSGEYDPTRGYNADAGGPQAEAVVSQAPRAPRGAAAAATGAGMTLVSICKNCGGAVMDLGGGMGRCKACGVEQILRPGKR